MTSVLIRDLPAATHSILVRRAREHGQSLQAYLTEQLVALAESPTMEEVLRRIEGRAGGRVGVSEALADLDAERASR